MNIEIGTQVRLKTFHRSEKPPEDVRKEENYWKLIGVNGVVMKKGTTHPAFLDMGVRVLVQFAEDIVKYGVACHNEQPNALWLFVADLDVVGD